MKIEVTLKYEIETPGQMRQLLSLVTSISQSNLVLRDIAKQAHLNMAPGLTTEEIIDQLVELAKQKLLQPHKKNYAKRSRKIPSRKPGAKARK
jgi:hypothetical protein